MHATNPKQNFPMPNFMLADRRTISIENFSRTIPAASMYVTKHGQSIAVILRGPIHDHPTMGPMEVIRPHRVYLSLAECQHATEPKHLVNCATHKAQKWMNDARAELWYRLTIDACRPLRHKCKPALQAIATWCRNNHGAQYWRKPVGRAALRSELSLLGIKCPPEGSVLDFVGLTI